MKTFKQFTQQLQEEAGQYDLNKILAPAMPLFDVKYHGLISRAIADLEPVINSGESIYKSDLDHFKTLKRPFEDAWRKAHDFVPEGQMWWVRYDHPVFKDVPHDSISSMDLPNGSINKTVTEVKGLLAAAKSSATAYVPQFEKMLVIATAHKALVDLQKDLKPRMASGKRPSKDVALKKAGGKYTGRIPAAEAAEIVRKALKAQFDPLLDRFEDNLVDSYTKAAAAIVKLGVGFQIDQLGPVEVEVLRHAFDFKLNRTSSTVNGKKVHVVHVVELSKRADAKDAIARLAFNERDTAEQQFLHKNVSKLAAIIDNKQVEPKIVQVSSSLAQGVITGTLRFEFPDGSSFVVVNKVVRKSRWNSSSDNYTYFHQFPTTFHDVKMSDGTSMSQPSEEKMHKTFK